MCVSKDFCLREALAKWNLERLCSLRRDGTCFPNIHKGVTLPILFKH